MNTTAISIRNVSKYYHLYDSPKHRLMEALHPLRRKYHHDFIALNDVSFEVNKGETVGIIGRNGSGKSTLLKIISGVLTPNSGTVTVNGRLSALLELGSGFNPELTGIENVYFNGTLMGISREEMDGKLEEILAFADIGEFVYQPVKSYSSGMFVRLAFAVAVCVEPEILIVDEALSVGDMAFQQKCLERLNTLKEKGVTILLVTHDIMLTRNYCEYVVYLQKGNVALIADAETAGEAYIKESRAETQKIATSISHPVAASDSVRFGSGDGEITQVNAENPSSGVPIYDEGDAIFISISARMINSIQFPTIYVQIRDSRGYILYGTNTIADELAMKEENGYFILSSKISMLGMLAPGEYGVTVSLINAPSEMIMTILDKRVAITTFTVIPKNNERAYHGAVNLKGAWRRMTSADVGNCVSDKFVANEAVNVKLVIGCVAENTPKYLAQALRLIQSVRWFGGRVANSKFIVCIVGEVDSLYRQEFEKYHADVRIVERFSDKHPQSNKLRFLQQPDLVHYQHVLLLDCDTIIVQDPSYELNMEGFSAKIADAPTVPLRIFESLFSYFKLPLPKENFKCTLTGTPTIPYFNAGVLLFSQSAMFELVPSWIKYNEDLIENMHLLENANNFCEQASLSLAIIATNTAITTFGNEMNFPIHFENYIDELNEVDPIIIHYHNCLDSDGNIHCRLYKKVKHKIDCFNSKLKKEKVIN